MQIDEESDCSATDNLMACLRFVKDTAANDDMMFCKVIRRIVTGKEIFKIVDYFMKGKSMKLSDCVGEYEQMQLAKCRKIMADSRL